MTAFFMFGTVRFEISTIYNKHNSLMESHLLKENYLRFFGTLQESEVPRETSVLSKALEQVGFIVSEPRPFKGSILKDPSQEAYVIEVDNIGMWGPNDKAKVAKVVDALKSHYSFRVAAYNNAVPKLRRKALIAFLYEV